MEENIKKQSQKESEKIAKERNLLQRRSFEFMFQMVFIIGAPALLAAYFGKKIGIEKDMHPKLMIILMIFALAFSWLIILIKFFKFNKQIRKIDEEIRKEKEQI